MNAIKSPIETPNGNIAERTGKVKKCKVKKCTVLRQAAVIKLPRKFYGKISVDP